LHPIGFHPYLMKYMCMICRGHVPLWRGRINKDVEPFIRYFMPEGVSCNRNTAGKAVRHLHLAFKGKTTEEIYDVLMMQLVRAIQKYDPSYTDEVRVVAEKIEDAFQKQFTILELNGRLDFDGNRYVRLLCRRGFLEAVKGGKGFIRSADVLLYGWLSVLLYSRLYCWL